MAAILTKATQPVNSHTRSCTLFHTHTNLTSSFTQRHLLPNSEHSRFSGWWWAVWWAASGTLEEAESAVAPGAAAGADHTLLWHLLDGLHQSHSLLVLVAPLPVGSPPGRTSVQLLHPSGQVALVQSSLGKTSVYSCLLKQCPIWWLVC